MKDLAGRALAGAPDPPERLCCGTHTVYFRRTGLYYTSTVVSTNGPLAAPRGDLRSGVARRMASGRRRGPGPGLGSVGLSRAFRRELQRNTRVHVFPVGATLAYTVWGAVARRILLVLLSTVYGGVGPLLVRVCIPYCGVAPAPARGRALGSPRARDDRCARRCSRWVYGFFQGKPCFFI